MTGTLFLIFFTIMASRYIQIRQRHSLEKFSQINAKLNKQHVNNHANLVWLEYMKINREVLSICKQIRAYSAYWSFFLTLMFPYYIILQCYVINIVALVPEVPLFERSLFMLVLVQVTIFFFLLIKECAQVVKLNEKILVENRRFFLRYFNYGKTTEIKSFYYQSLIKVN